MTLAFHPYANLFPLIEGQEFYDLAEDIRINGLHDRIALITVDGADQILDGRNRYRALVWLVSTGEVLGNEWGRWSGEPLSAERLSDLCDYGLYCDAPVENDAEALAFVLSKNLNRRHMSESQRAMVAADLATLRRGGDRSKAPIGALTDRQAADTLKVSERSVERAKGVKRAAVPEVVEAVKSGDLSVAAAAEIATQPVERQAEIAKALTRDASGKLTDDAKKALAPLIREIRVDKIAAKKERRAEREAETGRKIQALPGSFYGVAIEDFEWHHAAWSEETGSEKSPSMHYETAEDAQTPEAIVARCAERFACLAEDCIIFKWVTSPHLAIGIKVLELQGFRYVTSLVWNKERSGEARGPGYWFTGEHEIVLVGVRGKVVAPATAHFRSNFSAPVGGHSEKPDNLHEIIEFHWPTTPKVEFNARRRREGWAAWGFDAPDVAPAADTDARREAFVAYRKAQDDARLWQHPAIADLHVVKMMRDYQGDVAFDVAACQCGWSFRCECAPFDLARDKACDAHWREVIAQQSSAAVKLPPSDDPVFIEWKALAAIDARVGVSGPGVQDLIKRGLVVVDIDDELVVTDEGLDRMAELERRFNPDSPSAGVPSGETEAAAADATSDGASAAAAVSDGVDRAPYDAEDVIAIDQLAGSDWLAPSPDALAAEVEQLSEREQLKILSDFCHARRDLAPTIGPRYVAQGLTYVSDEQWQLRGAGWDRLRELEAAEAKPAAPADLTEPYRAPQPSLFDVSRQIEDAPPAEVVDGCLQTRLPVDAGELAEQRALLAIEAGEGAELEMLRHLVGKGLAFCGTTKISLTDDGRAFLAQLVVPADRRIEVRA
ncbi:transcriptional activator, adenine-specific DNA methyltransferase [Bradyrhizobium sp. YR681]|uniref:MT-A70 family methyltransferase n=1 Tax=Bradyrhizobium sp. YR681 TaxID=1144344 RepID=UPI000270E69A|nr:MT-A70 family methyltransferase [Bradyrhizobium sp. YR681]EJN15716.1 transcriptional activator, adenine-specific DNA methyltransferase [Bradyrhizobium sp. YR681]